MRFLKDLRGSKELLVNLTMREVKGKYSRTALGQLWSLANPLAAMAIYTVVFAFIIRIQPDPGDPSGLDIFALWLLCMLLPWTFFTNVVNGSMGALVGNENLIKKVHFPRGALIVATVASWMFTWAIEMAVLTIVLLIVGANPLPFLPLIVIAMIVFAVFATGVGLAFSIANVYFRDTQHFVTILFQMWFYLTPIVYPVRLVAEQSDRLGALFGDVTIMTIYQLNPLVQFAELFRNFLYDNRLPDLSTTLVCLAWAIGAFVIGATLFSRHEKGLAEAL
ncbi:O-antigen export system permease protein RfbD [Actinomycetales bacterium JB111]|nr:O-antigen export system permease protein RfbD [Actinomycetales bacterium JB111]